MPHASKTSRTQGRKDIHSIIFRIYTGLMKRNKMTSLGVEVTITSLIAFTYDH